MRRLFATFVRVGDLMMLVPLLRRLGQDAELTVIARPWAVDLLRGQPWVAAVHGLREPHKGSSLLGERVWGGQRRELAQRLHGQFDEVIGFQAESPTVKRMLRAIARDGQVRELRVPLRGSGHVVDRIAPGLADSGFAVEGFDAVPRLAVDPAALATAREDLGRLGRRVVAVQAGSSLTDKPWWRRRQPNLKGLDAMQWAGSIARILERNEADAVVFHGSAQEHPLAAAVIALVAPELRPRLHNRAGAVPLGDLPAQLAATSALISVDTGPAHIAAAVGTPLLSVFGPTDPQQYLPRGPGPVELLLGSAPCQFCHGTVRWETCRANICLTRLPAETIDAAWRRLHARLPAAS